jgi:hypothetical protein
MVHVHTVSVRTVAQLEEGAWYAVVGTDSSGLPLPPQVFLLEEKHTSPTVAGAVRVVGTLRAHLGDRIWVYKDRDFFPSQINIPEHGLHDIHFERIKMEDVPALLGMGLEQRDIWVQRQRNGMETVIPVAKWWATA